jgi:adenosine deaminase
MRFLADHRIRLNVCPTSNILLGRVKRWSLPKAPETLRLRSVAFAARSQSIQAPICD